MLAGRDGLLLDIENIYRTNHRQKIPAASQQPRRSGSKDDTRRIILGDTLPYFPVLEVIPTLLGPCDTVISPKQLSITPSSGSWGYRKSHRTKLSRPLHSCLAWLESVPDPAAFSPPAGTLLHEQKRLEVRYRVSSYQFDRYWVG